MDSQGKAKVALTFALYQGDQLVRRDTIAQDIVKVGKDPRSHLRVDDELASRMHPSSRSRPRPTSRSSTWATNRAPRQRSEGQQVQGPSRRSDQIGSTLIVLENAEPAPPGPRRRPPQPC